MIFQIKGLTINYVNFKTFSRSWKLFISSVLCGLSGFNKWTS